ncbi:MAG TPA: hypothetical protein VGZ47_06555 [Gemmataceae bacterium]|nr:hypothetical protein [Gemmataceae bacterium]
MPAEYFQWLGIPQPPEGGDYYVLSVKFLRDYLKDESLDHRDEFLQRAGHAMQWPWLAEDEPELANWIERNEKPLAIIAQAAQKSEYYNPLVPKRWTEDWPTSLIQSLLPNAQVCREVVAVLCARAMSQMNQGNTGVAWHVLITCHRFCRLLQRGGTLIELLIGIACEQITIKAELVFLFHSKMPSDQILGYWWEIKKLPAPSPVADKMDLTERFVLLQMILGMARFGPEYADIETKRGGSSAPLPPKENPFFSRVFTHSVNYDPAFRNANRYYDRLAASMRIPDRAQRERETATIITEIRAARLEAITPDTFIKKEFFGPSYRGKKIGEILVGTLLPAFDKLVSATDRLEQTHRNLHLAFALAAYHADHRRYPEALAELAPKSIDQIPDDLFSGKPLIYRLEGDGYLLYSVGVNGINDGGRGYDDDPKGDDLVIRMPVPEPKLKK